MTEDLKTELRRMGIGWFILKYAEDHGIPIGRTSTDYGTATAMNTRLSAYKRTHNYHSSMIKALKSDGLKNGVKAGDPVLDTDEIWNILLKL